MRYVGSEEFIRSQFEAYIFGLISSVKFHHFLVANADRSRASGVGADDPIVDYGTEWVDAWMRTENYRMWNAHTDPSLFAVSDPKHPCAGGLNIDDVQRRIADQVKELHLEERFAQGREMLGRNLAFGREKASTMLNRLYSDVEYLRESQRRRAEDAKAEPAVDRPPAQPAVDLGRAQQTMQSVGVKASAYVSSWAAWAGEKRRSGGWAAGWGRRPRSDKAASTPTSPLVDQTAVGSRWSSAPATADPGPRPATHASFSESILSRASGSHDDRTDTAESAAVLDADGSPSAPEPEPPASARATAAVDAGPADDGFRGEAVVGVIARPTGEGAAGPAR